MHFKVDDRLSFLVTGRLPQKNTEIKATGLTVLITGATSGIGYVTTLKYALMGANIIIVVRNRVKGQGLIDQIKTAYNSDIKLYIADFESLSDVKIAASKILNENTNIDILINNAGAYRTKKKILNNGLDSVFTVNHLSSLLLTKELIPILKCSRRPRVINVNSEGHRFGKVKLTDLSFNKRVYTGLKSYGASKTAQLHCMYILKEELIKDNITINSMHPGAVKSNIASHSGILYNLYMKYILSPMLKDPRISSDALYYLGVSPEMKGVSGNFYNLTNIEVPAPHAQQSEVSKEIYKRSLELIYNIGEPNE